MTNGGLWQGISLGDWWSSARRYPTSGEGKLRWTLPLQCSTSRVWPLEVDRQPRETAEVVRLAHRREDNIGGQETRNHLKLESDLLQRTCPRPGETLTLPPVGRGLTPGIQPASKL